MDNIKNEYVYVGYKRNCKPFKMSYKLYGNGENKVLFVMGFQLSGKYWGNVINVYMKQPEKYTICIFDHCGTGNSGYSFFKSYKELAMDMCELLNHLKWDKTHIVALSGGSAISWELAVMEPNLIKSLNILSIPSFDLKVPPFRQFLALPIYSRLHNIKNVEMYSRLIISDNFFNSPSKIKSNGLNKDFIMPLTSKMHDSRYDLKYLSRFSHWYSTAFHKITEIKDSDITKRPFPIVMFIGTDDPFMPNPSKFINIFKPNLIYICKNAGHCLQTEDPVRFNKLSMEFIDYANNFKLESSYENDEKNQFFVTKYLNYNIGSKVSNSNNPFPFKNSIFNLLKSKY